MKRNLFVSTLIRKLLSIQLANGQSVARQCNEQRLEAIRHDTPRPTVHARSCFHTNAAIYDAWSAYDSTSQGFLYDVDSPAPATDANRNEAISYAAYCVLIHRFASSPGAAVTIPALDAQMATLVYDIIGDNAWAASQRNFSSTVVPEPGSVAL